MLDTQNFSKTGTREFEPLELTDDARRIIGKPRARDRQVLPRLVREAVGRTGIDTFVEVGSWAGTTARLILDNTDLGRLFCVDWWKGSPSDVTEVIAQELGQKNIFRIFCQNCHDLLFRRLFPCVGRSSTFAEIWPMPVAGVYVDADHSYESCLEDMTAWYRHIEPGGVLCGHDYSVFPEVGRAVRDFCSARSLEHQVEGDVWWIDKPCESQKSHPHDVT